MGQIFKKKKFKVWHGAPQTRLGSPPSQTACGEHCASCTVFALPLKYGANTSGLRPSSTYSAFHSRSPTRAVTGRPVEIHAFEGNSRDTR
jgi:hypothetical protein